MKTLLLALGTIFSTLVFAGDIPTGELLVVLGFYNQNVTLTSPKIPKFEVITPELKTIQEEVYKLIHQERLSGTDAYYFLLAILTSESGVERFKERVLKNLHRYDLSPDEQNKIRLLLNGQALSEPIQNSAKGIDPKAAFDQVITAIAGLPKIFPNKEKLKSAMEFTRDLILGKNVGPCYGNDPNCVYGANYGLMEYVTRLLESDQKLLLDSIKFYIQLKKYQIAHPHKGDFSVFDENTEADQMPLVLKTTGGDAYQALRVVSIFMHDQCCTYLKSKGPLNPFLSLLSHISPTATHQDTPESILHAPGALGGLVISNRIKYRFNELRERSIALTGKPPKFMAGNYHYYGGLLTGGELIRHGYGVINGVKFSSFISQTLGYYYKKYTLPLWLSDDAKILWQQIGENENLFPEQPYGWSDQRFQLAQLSLDIQLAYLEHTMEQHRLGAELAYKIYMQGPSSH